MCGLSAHSVCLGWQLTTNPRLIGAEGKFARGIADLALNKSVSWLSRDGPGFQSARSNRPLGAARVVLTLAVRQLVVARTDGAMKTVVAELNL